MFKRIISKIGNAFKPKPKTPKVWKRDLNTPMVTGGSIKEITDKDPFDGKLEIAILKDKNTKKYTDISYERKKHRVIFGGYLIKENTILCHTHPSYAHYFDAVPSPQDILMDILYAPGKIKKPNMSVIIVKNSGSKSKTEMGRTYYKIKGFKDENGNLTADHTCATNILQILDKDPIFSNEKVMHKYFDTNPYEFYNTYLDIRFIFKPAEGYIFNKKKKRFEKIEK